jgi:predicted transcriptional regulator
MTATKAKISKESFTVAGVSKLNGKFKVRFTHDLTYVKGLSKAGNTEIELVDLPKAMTKGECVKHLKTLDMYTRPEYQAAIDAADEKYNGTAVVKVKATKAKTAKVTAEQVVAATKETV